MKAALIGLGVSSVVIVGLVAWGISREKAAPSSPAQNVVLFPDLKVGTVVVVDAVAAHFASPVALVVCVVDLVMSDTSVISVREISPGSGNKGTIPRSAILQVLALSPDIQI